MDENLENMEGENLLVDFKSTDGNRRYNTPKKRQKSFGERSKNLSDLVQTSENGSSSNLLESDLSFTDDACTGSNGVLTEPSNEVNVIQAHQRVHLNSFHQLSPPELGRNLQSDSFSVEEDGASSFKTNGRPSNTTNKLMESSPSFAPRAKPVSPHLYMHMAPPTMLTMCPSCKRVHGGAPRRRRTPLHRLVPVPTAAGMGLRPWRLVPGRPMFVDSRLRGLEVVGRIP